jgi:hypothetical protein
VNRVVVRMPYSEAVLPTRLEFRVSSNLVMSHLESHRAISPRFAMSTEVSGLVAGAMVEL